MTGRWAVVALIFLGILISYVDRGNVSIVAVPLMNEFQLSSAQMGVLMSSFFWTYALAQVPAGYVVDRFGIRASYCFALVAWSMAGMAVAWAESFTHLLLLRLVLGVGEAVSPVASLSYIKQNFEEKAQGLPTAIYIAGLTAGPGVGAFLGAQLLDQFGWRKVFLFTGLAGLAWAVPWWFLAPRSEAAVKRTAAAPLPLASLLRSRLIWALWASVFFYSYFWYFVLNWMPPYLVLTHGFTTREMGSSIGWALLGMAVVNLTSAWLADGLIRRGGAALGWRKVFVLTGFVLASSLLLVLRAPSRGWVIAALAFAMCSLGVASGNFWALSQMAAPKSVVGRVLGLQNTIAQFAGILAPSLTGFLLGPEKNFTVAIWIAGCCPLIAALILLWAVRADSVERLHESLARAA